MQKEQRMAGLTLLAIFVFGIAAWNGLRLIQSIFFWSTLNEYNAKPGALYLAVTGGFWLLAGLGTFWGLWRLYSWGWYAALIAAPSYAAWYWVDRLVEQQPHSNWPFALILTLIILFLFAIILLPVKTRRVFLRGHHE